MHQLKDSSYISEMRPENAVTRKIDKKMSVDLRHHVPHLREKTIKIKPWNCILGCYCVSGKVYRGSTIHFSHSVVSDSLWPHEPQHARSPCPSPTSGIHPSPCPLNRWCHITVSSPVVPFFSCPQSFPASGSFQMSQLFTSGGQSIEVSASKSVLPMNTQDWSTLGWTAGSPCSPRDSQESYPTP